MNRFYKELQRRGVLRVAGLYIALTWLILQVSDVVFPAFGVPDHVLRYVLFIAMAGLPLALLFAWFYEITSEGIVSEEEIGDQEVKRTSKNTVTVITLLVLSLALTTSLYVNFRLVKEQPTAPQQAVSILVADFENTTGDTLFDGSLEPALTIGMEGAPFISAYPRPNALAIAKRINETQALSESAARLVSVREGIDLVATGAIERDNDGYYLTQSLIDPKEGTPLLEVSSTAETKADVLTAVSNLASQIREELGDLGPQDGDAVENETFTAASLEAVKFYTEAQNYAFLEQNKEAAAYFQRAVEEDPNFGRAYTGWALSELKLGNREKSDELWQKAFTLMDGISERERYRTLGIYYLTITGNFEKAIENFELLVEKYPADLVGWNNLGVAYFYTLRFDKAFEVGSRLVERSPGNPAFLTNNALFAMYAGEFTQAQAQAETVLSMAPEYFLAYLPLAMARIAAGDLQSAIAAYTDMGQVSERARSTSIIGLADIAMLTGDYARAAELLSEGQTEDARTNNTLGVAYKIIHQARAEFFGGDPSAARSLMEVHESEDLDISGLVPAALLYVDMGETTEARKIQAQLASKLQQGQRAAADLISGVIQMAQGDWIAAVDTLSASLQRRDAWLTRFFLGRAYAEAGYPAEALGEFQRCEDRIGEATSIFLDDTPTFQYQMPLLYWLGRTKQELGMTTEAIEAYEQYLSYRVADDESPQTLEIRERREQILKASQ